MAFDISAFKANFPYGGARPNLFEATVVNPISGLGDPSFRFVCRAAQIPAATIPAIDVPYFGRQVRFAGNRVFEPWTVTIINDEGFNVRNALEQWMQAINSHEPNLQTSPQTVYKQSATVKHFGKDGSTIATYEFTGLFPTDVSTIELSWDANDQMEEYTVTFAYDYWNHVGITT